MVELRNVTKKYDNGTLALDGVNLKIEEGEFVFIVGPSGAGKSTLLKLLMKEEEPTDGIIRVNKYNLNRMKRRQVPYFRRTMGIVFQDFRLISDMTVFENVAFAMRVIGCSKKSINRRVPYVLKLMGLEHKMQNYPNELAGGEQQRVALARALVNNPSLIIADEPTGNVDPRMSWDIMDLLSEINKRKTTVLVVTHEKSLVDRLRKRVVSIEHGKIVSDRMEGMYR
ncbi:cell division ATP-binding protein FtsE [Feifania hominis]|uniref:Cell division ATP-binding protein FtsE n=1 Tax=Feifania hominis TaxID=2763660 RepID=A0A926HT79_9FIRM|nr:cell division ATP-binding protein FtsE [Feifania hominis]